MKKPRDPRKEFEALFQPQTNHIVMTPSAKRALLASIEKNKLKKKFKAQDYDIHKQKCKICLKQATRCSLRNGIFIHFCKEHAPEDAGRYLDD